MKKGLFLSVLFLCSAVALPSLSAEQAAPVLPAPTQPAPVLPRMQFLGKFSAGVPNAGIYKLYDKTDDIVCYVLMPDIPDSKRIPQGVIYSGNSIGSISCVKVKLHVLPLMQKALPPAKGKKAASKPHK